MVKNKTDRRHGVFYSKYVADWGRGTGELIYGKRSKLFEEWLRSLDLYEEDIAAIQEYAEEDLVHSAERFYKNALSKE